MEKVKNFFTKNTKLLAFIAILMLVYSVYNSDNMSINALLKKGIVLEYNLKNDININQEKSLIENHLRKNNVKCTFINKIENKEQNPSVQLHIALPITLKKDRADLINNISDFIFNKYNNSELNEIRMLNGSYHIPYSGFINGFIVLFLSSSIWLILLYLSCNTKKLFHNTKENLISYSNKQKTNFIDFFKKTKEKGIGYFFKKLILEDDVAESDESATKEIINTILFVLICVVLIRFFIGELRWIPSGSMYDTILKKDRVFVEKLEFPKKEIKRGDIIVFYPPNMAISNKELYATTKKSYKNLLKNPFEAIGNTLRIASRLTGIFCKDMAYIKRVIGMPNDKFEIKYNKKTQQHNVYINDKILNEPYILPSFIVNDEKREDWTQCNEKMFCGPFIIPEDHYFMMGDNRGNSADSRFWGFLPKENIIGRANFMFWPIARINTMRDKYIILNQNKKEKKEYILNRYELFYKI